MITPFLTFSVEKYRRDFPMLRRLVHGKPLVYLDSAATALTPQVVIDEIADYYQNSYGTVHRSIYTLASEATEKYNQVREKVGKLLNSEKSEEIVFTRGNTDALNLLAYSFGKAFVGEGDEILISEMEHHSNIVPWQIMCEERKAVLRVIPMDDQGELLLDEYQKLLNEKTKIVAITHVSNALGTVNPIKEIAEMAHQAGAKIVVDGAQAVPHMQVDVRDLNVDFYTFSPHKAYGPTGVGILYGKYDLLEQLPPYQGGGDMVDKLTFEKTSYNPPPIKFEAGTPMIAQVMGLGAAVDYLTAIGLDEIHHWGMQLLTRATVILQGIDGLHILGNAKNKDAVLSFVVDGIHPLDIATMLDFKGIAIRTGHHCAQPTLSHFNLSAAARASFALYNTLDEVEYFGSSLKEVIEELR